jgi:hypothetical protein
VIWRAIENEVSNASDFVSARSLVIPTCERKNSGKGGPSVEVESLANDQERFFSRKKCLSSPRDILIRRVSAESSRSL